MPTDFIGQQRRVRGARFALLLVASLVVSGAVPALAQSVDAESASTQADAASNQSLAQRSLPLRRALHKDPTLGAPLERLVQLYREANASDRLVSLYENHLQQWPDDAGARVVLLRVLSQLDRPALLEKAKQAVQRHPEPVQRRCLVFPVADLPRGVAGPFVVLEGAVVLPAILRDEPEADRRDGLVLRRADVGCQVE